MWWRAILGWGIGLWLAAGCEAGFGIGFPGPLLLVALAAGLASGPTTGAVVGLFAGLCGAALAGSGHIGLCAAGAGAGALMGVASSWVSRRNPAWALLAAGVASLCFALLLGLLAQRGFGHAGRLALQQAGINMLWMIPVYGGVLLCVRRPRALPEEMRS
jgi:hypothetical protein